MENLVQGRARAWPRRQQTPVQNRSVPVRSSSGSARGEGARGTGVFLPRVLVSPDTRKKPCKLFFLLARKKLCILAFFSVLSTIREAVTCSLFWVLFSWGCLDVGKTSEEIWTMDGFSTFSLPYLLLLTNPNWFSQFLFENLPFFVNSYYYK